MYAAFNDAYPNRVSGEPGGVVDVELDSDVLTMLFDRFDADAEFGRRFLVGSPFGDHLENLDFASRERDDFLMGLCPAVSGLGIEAIRAFGDGRAKERVSLVHFPNGKAQFVGGGLF